MSIDTEPSDAEVEGGGAQGPRPAALARKGRAPWIAGHDLRGVNEVVDRVEYPFTSEDERRDHWDNVRALRTELLLSHPPGERADCIAVVSSGSGEGRSLLAGDLAVAFAQAGMRTLLVDCDLRKPSLHLQFGAARGPGLSDAVLRGGAPRLHAVRGHAALYLLTAGTETDDPVEVLAGHGIGPLREFWSSTFEVVVMDSPAAALHADALALAIDPDLRLLLVTRAQHTRNRDLDPLLRRLSALPATVAGAVVKHF